MEGTGLYILLALFVVLTVLLMFSGLENIIKMLVGNYIIAVIIYALGVLLSSIVQQLQGLEPNFANNILLFLADNGKTTILIILYVLLIFFLYKKSSIGFDSPVNINTSQFFYIFASPMASAGVFAVFYMIFYLSGLVNESVVISILQGSIRDDVINMILNFYPIFIFLHSLFTLILSFSFSAGSGFINESIDIDDL